MSGLLPLEPATVLADAMPAPVCLGVPAGLWVEALQTEQDVWQFWQGHALGGAVCAIILIIEILAIQLLA